MDSSSQKNDVVRPSDIGMLLFLTLLNVINFIDRQLLVSLSNWIKPELHLSNFESGLLDRCNSGLIQSYIYLILSLDY